MSERLERTLAAMDVGLQSSDEHGYPPRWDNPDACARCLLNPPAKDGEDLCGFCRAYLLGDSDEDPRYPRWAYEGTGVVRNTRTFSWVPSEFSDADARWIGPTEITPATDGTIGHRSWPVINARALDPGRYAVHHIDGDRCNNDPANLDLVDIAENVARQSSGFTDAMRRVNATLAQVDVATMSAAFREMARAADVDPPSLGHSVEEMERQREDALQRLARGLGIPPELVREHRHHDWQAAAWEQARQINADFAAWVEMLAQRYEEQAR